jgi:succinate-semialdehyde dehydrogenase / glutarate-semialdehyde dehydrogenase
MLYIDGEWRSTSTGKTFAVTNPATGEVVGEVADGTSIDALAAIGAADAAFREWSGRTAYERAEILRTADALVRANNEHLAQTMTTEQGKPIRAARIEVNYAADFLTWFAGEAIRVYGQTVPSSRADQRFIVMRQPVGVCVAITPWNYPVSMLTRKIAPALAAGCTVVLKPAEQTPLCAIEVIKLLEQAGVPKGVVNLVTTSDPVSVGEVLLNDRRVRKLTFTGSTEVGKLLMAQASGSMKRISMELGGHAPFIVFDDADPVRAATGAAMVKVLNTGQACICPNRLYVQRGISDEFISALTARVSKMKAGSGFTEGVQIAPLIDREALEKVERQVVDAVAKGATVTTGGRRLTASDIGDGFHGGNFYAPTVLTGVTPEMLIYREETFGPVAPVIVFDDPGEVIEMANDTDYGLASYVYTNDLSRAWRTAEALRFGIVGINDINPTGAAAPFGGVKESGLGREGGQEGIGEYLDTKLVGLSI